MKTKEKKIENKNKNGKVCWKVMNGHWIIGWLCAITVCSSEEIEYTHKWLLDFRKNISVTFDTCKINWNTAGTITTITTIITSVNSCGGCSKSKLIVIVLFTVQTVTSIVNSFYSSYVESSAKKKCSLHGEFHTVWNQSLFVIVAAVVVCVFVWNGLLRPLPFLPS